MQPDPRIDQCGKLWATQRRELDGNIKDKIGKIYIVDVLGLSQQVADDFATGSLEAWGVVGQKQSAIPNVDEIDFWMDVSQLFPEPYPRHILHFLCAEGGSLGILFFLWDLITPFGDGEPSPVIRLLQRNAIAHI